MEMFQQNSSGVDDWWRIERFDVWRTSKRCHTVNVWGRKRVVKVNWHFYRFARSWLCQEEAPRGNQQGATAGVQDCNIFLASGGNIFCVERLWRYFNLKFCSSTTCFKSLQRKDWFLVLILALYIKLWRLTSFVICSFFSKYANTKMLQRLKVNFVWYLWYIYEAIDMCYTKARYLCDRHWYSRGVAQLFSYIAIYFIGWAEMWLRYIQGHFHFLIYHIWRQKGPLQINHLQLNITGRYIIFFMYWILKNLKKLYWLFLNLSFYIVLSYLWQGMW